MTHAFYIIITKTLARIFIKNHYSYDDQIYMYLSTTTQFTNLESLQVRSPQSLRINEITKIICSFRDIAVAMMTYSLRSTTVTTIKYSFSSIAIRIITCALIARILIIITIILITCYLSIAVRSLSYPAIPILRNVLRSDI